MSGHPIRVIEAGGMPDDFGKAIGEAVGESVRACVLGHEEFRATADAFQGTDYLKALTDAAGSAYPRYMRELEAMAEGAGLTAEQLFLWNCRGDLRFPPDTAKARLDRLTEGCTTLIAPGDFDAGRPAVIAHNEDGAGAFMAHRFWLKAAPADAPGFESFLYPGMLPGHSVAVTQSGLVQTINNIRPDDLKPGVPRHFICRAVLDEETIPGAIQHLRRDDRASGFHHAIGAVGEPVPLSIEAPASSAVIRTVGEATAHANHLLDGTFKGLAQNVTQSSAYRQWATEKFLRDGGDPERPEDILFQRDGDGGESVLRRPGDGGDDYGCTLATAVFRIHADHIDWTVHDGPGNRDVLSGSVAGAA